MMRLIGQLFTAFALVFLPPGLFAAGKAAHVVVIVWDGMRPDLVSTETTPNLFRLAQEGVTFKHHHPAYVTTTEVNGTALATGDYPAQSGVIGNNEFRPAISATDKFMTADLAPVRKGDEVTGNHYLAVPTLAESLHEHGMRTIVAGAKPVVLLQDRAPRQEGALGTTVFEGRSLPESLSERLSRELGKFPGPGITKTYCDDWTTEALTGPLWEQGVPPFSLLWLSEPDYSQHGAGPGSAVARAAIRGSDKNLARVLAALREKGLSDQTDIIVVSDHGFSTVVGRADVAAVLQQNGLRARRRLAAPGGEDGDILVVSNGGSALIYVIGHNEKLITQAVHCLQAQAFCGVVFTQKPVEGTFTLAEGKINAPSAPDIVVSLRWQPDQNANGTPGLLWCEEAAYRPGQGTHGSLSPYDLHNTCIAAGPDFRKGMSDELPSGNIDIAPTVMWILGVKMKPKFSGRVLSEALVGGGAGPAAKSHHLEATWRGNKFVWHQYLDTSEVGETGYLDAGNGEQTP